MSTEVAQTNSLKRSVAEEIRALLGRQNMSKLQLAQRIDRSHTYMWRRLNGEVAFDLDDLERIATVLGVGIVDLLPRDRRTPVTLTFVDPLMDRVVDHARRPFRNSAPTGGRPSNRADRRGPPSGPRRASRVLRPSLAT